MKLTELELSKEILKTVRNASVFVTFASVILFLNLPNIGLITYIIIGALLIFSIYALIITLKSQQNINKFKQNAEKTDIKLLRNMIFCLMDENLKEERNDSIYFSVGMLILSLIIAAYSFKMNQMFMGISAFTFLFSCLSYAKAGILYQQLIKESIIEEKTLVKIINPIKNVEFKENIKKNLA